MYQNVYTPLQHLLKPPVKPGGLCWIVFARKSDVLNWPTIHPATNLAYTAIKLKEGKTWFQLKVVNKDRLFTESQEDSGAGPYWKHQVNGYFGGNSAQHTLVFGVLPFEELVVMFQDRDGSIRFIGNEDAGATLKNNYTSGDSDSSRKRSLSFSWEHPEPAPIYIGSLGDILDNVITPPFAGLGDFGDDFNEDFNI